MTTQTAKAAQNYPLFVSYRLPVACNGFFAGITVKGRILLTDEGDGEVWTYGINPGGISAFGSDQAGAVAAFYERFCSTLYDLAEDGDDFPTFKKTVEDVFNCTNDLYEKLWLSARQDVRAGRIDLAGMPRETADVKHSITVEKITHPVASDNPSAREMWLASKAA